MLLRAPEDLSTRVSGRACNDAIEVASIGIGVCCQDSSMGSHWHRSAAPRGMIFGKWVQGTHACRQSAATACESYFAFNQAYFGRNAVALFFAAAFLVLLLHLYRKWKSVQFK